MRRTPLPLLCAVFLVLLSHRTSSACLCMPEPFEETVASADIAFLGEVLPGNCSEPQRIPEVSWPEDDPNGCFLAVHTDGEQCGIVGATQELVDAQGKVIQLTTGADGTSLKCGLTPGKYTVRSQKMKPSVKQIEISAGQVTRGMWWDSPEPFLAKARVKVLESYKEDDLQDEYWIDYDIFGTACGLGYMAPGERWRIAADYSNGRLMTSSCSARRSGRRSTSRREHPRRLRRLPYRSSATVERVARRSRGFPTLGLAKAPTFALAASRLEGPRDLRPDPACLPQ